MATTASLISRVRLELGDSPQPFQATLPTNGARVHDLGYRPVDPTTLALTLVNGGSSTALTSPTNYVLDADAGTVTLASTPANGTTLVAVGTAYRYFTDASLALFVDTAVAQHLHNRTDEWGRAVPLSQLSAVEEYPVALLAVVEALFALMSGTATDIDITTPEGVHIPRGQRFQQLSVMIQERQNQYAELCSALNVGLHRVEMMTLRRISKATGRLIPVYRPQEIDDPQGPLRVWGPVDTQGATPLPEEVGRYDIVVYRGEDFSTQFDFDLDLTPFTVSVTVRRYPGDQVAASVLPLVATVTDAAAGTVTVTVSHTKTALFLQGVYFYTLQLADSAGSVRTYMHGLLTVLPQS